MKKMWLCANWPVFKKVLVSPLGEKTWQQHNNNLWIDYLAPWIKSRRSIHKNPPTLYISLSQCVLNIHQSGARANEKLRSTDISNPWNGINFSLYLLLPHRVSQRLLFWESFTYSSLFSERLIYCRRLDCARRQNDTFVLFIKKKSCAEKIHIFLLNVRKGCSGLENLGHRRTHCATLSSRKEREREKEYFNSTPIAWP